MCGFSAHYAVVLSCARGSAQGLRCDGEDTLVTMV